MDLGAFRLQAQITLFLRSAADTVDELSIHRKLHNAVDSHDIIGIPLAAPEAAIFERTAARPAWIIWNDIHATNAEQISVDVARRERNTVSLVHRRKGKLQHLHLKPIRQAVLFSRPRGAPQEHARISARFHVAPFDVQYEVLILLLAAHNTDGMAGADQRSVFDFPRIGRR